MKTTTKVKTLSSPGEIRSKILIEELVMLGAPRENLNLSGADVRIVGKYTLYAKLMSRCDRITVSLSRTGSATGRARKLLDTIGPRVSHNNSQYDVWQGDHNLPNLLNLLRAVGL